MIELTYEEAQNIYSAINLGLTSFMRDECLDGLNNEYFQHALEERQITRHLLSFIIKGKNLIEKK